MKKFVIILTALLISSSICLAEKFSIVALVNDQIISFLDLESRMKLIFGTSNIPYNNDTVNHFRPQIMHQLIDDVLKIEEAKKLGITISEEEIEDAITTVEKNNNMNKGDLLKIVASFGISPETLKLQMKSEVAWLKIARRNIMPNIQVSNEEVNDFLSKKKANVGKPEMLVSEIFLPVDEPQNEEEVLNNAKQIIGYVASGVDFGAIAKQFSQSPTAGNGGDLGWVYEGQLTKELDEVINKMTPPSISPPIKTRYGYYILLLRDKRLSLMPDEAKALYTLSQIFIPKETLSIVKDSILGKIKTIKSCEDFNTLAKELATENSGSLGTIPAAKMPPQILDNIKNLDIGTPSRLVPVNEGDLVLMVCDKNIPGGLPDAETVRQQLEIEKLDKMARRKLRELRRSAIIEIRN